MARARAKADLPHKDCVTCGRPFSWRRKWANCWDDVKYCSQRCRNHRVKEPTDAASPKSD
ncbi:MAG: DUF2256 domain-containing protein [Rhodospirillaceae bacterium]